MADQLEIIGGLLYRVMRILAEVGEASPDELWMRMRASDAGADPGWRRGSGDDPRSAVARKLVLRGAVYLARAGHLSESNRRWQATGIGRDALRASPDEAAWWRDVTEHNTYWREHRSSLGLVDDVLAVLPEQTWVSVTDLSTVADLTVDGLVRHLCGFRPEGWSRVLDPAGRPPREALFTEDEYRDWLDWFEVEVGDLTAGRAAGELRLPLDDLRMLVESIAPERIPRRAWLVRGADRRGRSLARDLWLADEVCSLPGDRLEVRPGVDREQVRRAVDREHASLTSARRGRLTSEYHAFLSRMRENDLVVVNDRDEYYVGEILGPPVFVASVGGVADLQRPVHWRNADEPVNYLDLPDRVAALLGNAEARIVDLSDFVATSTPWCPRPRRWHRSRRRGPPPRAPTPTWPARPWPARPWPARPSPARPSAGTICARSRTSSRTASFTAGTGCAGASSFCGTGRSSSSTARPAPARRTSPGAWPGISPTIGARTSPSSSSIRPICTRTSSRVSARCR
ncbi:hypothetical protein [Frankia sp. BMG5.23]|uniref:hypothetical protein n=1 Tax=Frankia sp. BMG5.23 TaxID=683305 RepID=UPI001F1C31F0|nr:hypothetical protein [Frankia sp. BMG5.23]